MTLMMKAASLLLVGLALACSGAEILDQPAAAQPLLEKRGGRTSYIIGGNDVSSVGKWPWHAALYYFAEYNCGAALISTWHAITAAHCTDVHTPRALGLRFGMHTNSYGPGAPVFHEVYRVYNHPDYDNRIKYSYPNDISVVFLKSEVTLNDFVKTIEIADMNENIVNNPDCWITGWGKTAAGPWPWLIASTLKELHVNIDEDGKEGIYNCKRRRSSICVKSVVQGGGACDGDSGGPLMCKSTQTNQYVLLGVFSTTSGNCDTRSASVYTSARYVKSWIQEVMQNTTQYIE